MANEEHLARLRDGVDAWNAWREKDPDNRSGPLQGGTSRGEPLHCWSNLIERLFNCPPGDARGIKLKNWPRTTTRYDCPQGDA